MAQYISITEALSGVGKKARASYLVGKMAEKELMLLYARNKKEVDTFSTFGMNFDEIVRESKATHNPLLRNKLLDLIRQHAENSHRSVVQNDISLAKLDYYLDSALGIGLRNVMKELSRVAHSAKNQEAEILLLLMEIEFANLAAKKHHKKKKQCYERKSILLMQLSHLLGEMGWRAGISTTTGKNASYIVYVYLPDGTQLSWHCNDWQMIYYYDDIDCQWDGLACSTFEKLFSYIHEKFGIGTDLIKLKQIA